MPLSFVQFAPYSQLSTFRFLSGRARRSEVSVAVPALSYLVMQVFSPRDVIRPFAPASFLSVSLPLLFLFWGVLIPPHLDGFCTPRLPPCVVLYVCMFDRGFAVLSHDTPTPTLSFKQRSIMLFGGVDQCGA